MKKTTTIAFRISSLYPERVDDALCKVIVSNRIRPHFHLSVQSGSDSILKAMNRPYKSNDVIEATKRLRKIKPNCFLACDIITGFPGETEEDFNNTKDLCEKCDFTWIHCFPFSPRPGTPAFSMKNKVPQNISNGRVKELTEFAIKQKKAYLDNLIGTTTTAIIEKRKKLPLKAVTDNFIHVEIISDKKESQELLNTLGGKQVFITFSETCTTGSQTEATEAKAYINS